MKIISEESRYENGRRVLTQVVEYTLSEDLRELSQAQNALAYQLERLEGLTDAAERERAEAAIRTLKGRVTRLSAAVAGYTA